MDRQGTTPARPSQPNPPQRLHLPLVLPGHRLGTDLLWCAPVWAALRGTPLGQDTQLPATPAQLLPPRHQGHHYPRPAAQDGSARCLRDTRVQCNQDQIIASAGVFQGRLELSPEMSSCLGAANAGDVGVEDEVMTAGLTVVDLDDDSVFTQAADG